MGVHSDYNSFPNVDLKGGSEISSIEAPDNRPRPAGVYLHWRLPHVDFVIAGGDAVREQRLETIRCRERFRKGTSVLS